MLKDSMFYLIRTTANFAAQMFVMAASLVAVGAAVYVLMLLLGVGTGGL